MRAMEAHRRTKSLPCQNDGTEYLEVLDREGVPATAQQTARGPSLHPTSHLAPSHLLQNLVRARVEVKGHHPPGGPPGPFL